MVKPLHSRNRGAAMTLILVMGLFLLVVLLVFAWRFLFLQVRSSQSLNAAQSAALTAARELGRIVIKDEDFGYIGLYDSPPVGKSTLAADGEPTPVTGINSLMAGVRCEMLVADTLNNSALREFAEDDYKKAQAASTRLFKVLNAAIQPTILKKPTDLNGVKVDPLEAARESYLSNSHGLIAPSSLKEFDISLGWIDTSTTSSMPFPMPAKLSQTPATAAIGDCYKAFTDIPVGKHSFFLAGLGKQPALVDGKFFRAADGKRVCSAVRVDAVAEAEQPKPGESSAAQLKASATAVPGASTTLGPAGVLLVTINPAAAPSASSLHNLLGLNAMMMKVFSANGGDYPRDKQATLVETGRESAAKACSRCLFDWLRTAGGRVNLDSLQEAIDHPFSSLSLGAEAKNANVFYELDRSGAVHVTTRKRNPFIDSTASENQYYAVMDTGSTLGGAPIALSCRDQVSHLGLDNGGKHAGQPQPANPINWCDLPYFDNSAGAAKAMGRGSDYLGLVARGNRQGCAGGQNAISIASAVFENVGGQSLSPQPRKSYYGGGLAASIEVSSR